MLGLVGRDLVLDIVTAVADETPAAAFELSGRAVELGYDLRSVVRELSRVVRDLLVLSVDPSRIDDPEIASESERDRLKGLVSRFSREDLLRAFDVLSKAEFDIRAASQPRYHLEMALLRWIHMRKLVPLTELLGGVGAKCTSSCLRLAAPGGRAGRNRQDPPSSRQARAPVVPPVERRTPGHRLSRRSPRVPERAKACRAEARECSGGRRRTRRLSPGNPQVEERVLQHGRRAGAED